MDIDDNDDGDCGDDDNDDIDDCDGGIDANNKTQDSLLANS